MLWYDWLIIILITVSFLIGLLRGFMKSFVKSLKIILSPLLIIRFAPLVADLIVKNWDLGKIFSNTFLEILEPTVIKENNLENIYHMDWTLAQEETMKYLNQLEMPDYFRTVLMSTIKPEILENIMLKYQDSLNNTAELLVFYIGHGLAYIAAIFIAAAIIFVLTAIIIRTVFFFAWTFQKESEDLGVGDRLLGGIWSAFFSLVILSGLLIFAEPVMSFLTVEYHKTELIDLLLSVKYYIQPWLEEAVRDFFMEVI